MSALAVKKGAKGAKPDQARTKKLVIGCLGVIVLGYAASSMMAKSATSKPPPKLAATVKAPGTATAPGAAAPTGTPTAANPAGSATAGSVPTTTPWAPSPRNPFVTVPQP